jgi:hypothetical protein
MEEQKKRQSVQTASTPAENGTRNLHPINIRRRRSNPPVSINLKVVT